MKAIIFGAAFLAALLCASGGSAHANGLTAVTAPGRTAHRVHFRIRHYVSVHRRTWPVSRKVMLCVLPPDVQVAWDWPGPACAYRDNFIFPPHRRRYYVN
jgi:hypothetical protein